MNLPEPSNPRCVILAPLAVALCAASDWSTPEARFVSACIVAGTVASMVAGCLTWRVLEARSRPSDADGDSGSDEGEPAV